MNRNIKAGLLITVLLILTACGADGSAVTGGGEEISPPAEAYEVSAGDSSNEGESQPRSREELRRDYAENALQPASQLVLGTFMLEETELAVDAELAPYLVPYWKLYRSLLESDTTAPEELDALIAEIQVVMDADQINYIASLELTQDHLTTYMISSGIMESLRQNGTEAGDGTRPNRPEGMPEGTGPGGGRGQGGGQDGTAGLDPELMATMQAEREAAGGGGGMGDNRMITPLIEALIEMLESKAS